MIDVFDRQSERVFFRRDEAARNGRVPDDRFQSVFRNAMSARLSSADRSNPSR